jgi:hypothetical protein
MLHKCESPFFSLLTLHQQKKKKASRKKMTTTGWVFTGLGVGLLGLGGYGGYSLYNAGKQLKTTQTIRVHSFDLQDLKIAIKVNVTNPSNSSLVVRNPPYVELYSVDAQSEKRLIGISIPSKEYIKIEANSTTELDEIFITIPTIKLAGMISDLIDDSAENINLEIMVKIDVLFLGVIPFSITQMKKEQIPLPANFNFNSIKNLIFK